MRMTFNYYLCSKDKKGQQNSAKCEFCVCHLLVHGEEESKNNTLVLLQFGQVGIGSTQDSVATPQLIAALQNDRVSQFACGWRHTLALTQQGQMYSWGRGVNGQLGHAETLDL